MKLASEEKSYVALSVTLARVHLRSCALCHMIVQPGENLMTKPFMCNQQEHYFGMKAHVSVDAPYPLGI